MGGICMGEVNLCFAKSKPFGKQKTLSLTSFFLLDKSKSVNGQLLIQSDTDIFKVILQTAVFHRQVLWSFRLLSVSHFLFWYHFVSSFSANGFHLGMNELTEKPNAKF